MKGVVCRDIHVMFCRVIDNVHYQMASKVKRFKQMFVFIVDVSPFFWLTVFGPKVCENFLITNAFVRISDKTLISWVLKRYCSLEGSCFRMKLNWEKCIFFVLQNSVVCSARLFNVSVYRMHQ